MKSKAKKFISYYKPYKFLFFTDLFFAVLGAVITLIIPLIVRYITSTVVYYSESAAVQTIIKLGIAMVGLVALEFVCNFYMTYYGHIMGAKIEYNMRNEIFEHYQKLSFSFFDNQKVGQLLSRATTDLFEISELLHHGPEDILISVIKFIGSFIILSSISMKLTLITYASIPILLIYAYIFNKKMKKAFKRNRANIANINTQIEDNLSGIRVVKSFANEHIELEKFNVGNGEFLKSKKNSYLYMGSYHSGINALTTMVTITVLVFGSLLLANKSIDVPILVTFLLYINNFTEPVKKLVNFTEQFQNGYTGYERFLEIIEVEPDIADKTNAKSMSQVRGDVVFEDVTFKYEETTNEVLTHVNLDVKAGKYVALVGNSGAGKTTLCSLIPRFYDVTSGRILIDGVDIRDIKVKELRKNIGIVQQDVYLFAGNVMDNIRYGRPEATDEEVIWAAKQANAHEFIMELPMGYHSDIGQRGVKISGGQKQRLSIARVFLKNPPILIFDEATSALDNESERIVQESLEKLAENRTTFVIAHRLSTIRNAERILVLTDKGVEEEGSHDELIEKKGIYETLYNMQFAKKPE